MFQRINSGYTWNIFILVLLEEVSHQATYPLIQLSPNLSPGLEKIKNFVSVKWQKGKILKLFFF